MATQSEQPGHAGLTAGEDTELHSHEAHTARNIAFSSIDDDPSAGDIVDGFPNGIPVGEPGEHGTFTAIRAKATCDDANKGTGTNTIVVEVDNNPAFSSATILFTLPLAALGEVDDTGLDNAWDAGDIFVRARWTAVGATKPQKVRVFFYFKEKAVNP